MESSPPHVAVVAFPFSSHAAKLLGVARALAAAAPSATFTFLSTAESLARLGRGEVPGNLRFVEVPSGAGDGDDLETAPVWRRMELFMEAAEAGGLRRALETAAPAAAGGARVTCVVGDAFMCMSAADDGVPWVAVWTGSPFALLAHLRGDAIREDIGDDGFPVSRGDELLAGHPGLGSFRVRDLPFGGANPSGGMHRVMMGLILRRVGRRLPSVATALALNSCPGLLPPDVSAAIAAALPNSLPFGPYHLLPGAAAAAPADDDPNGCLPWLARHPAGTVAYVSFGTIAALPPDELRELAAGLEASGAPFLWSLRESSWPLLPPGFLDRAAAEDSAMLLVPWAPQAAVLRHPAVGAFVTHSGWGSVVEAMSGGVPMLCRPFIGDQLMNARAVERLWGFGAAFEDGVPMTRGVVAEKVALLIAGEEGVRMRARARELQAMVVKAFEPGGGCMTNFHKFVDIVCARV
ncbi:hypothetical protein ACP4OV_019092 [Aristida adscensionis]